MEVKVVLRQGSVVSEIQSEIDEGGYDLVVTGSSRKRSGVRSYMLGDITREIVNRAACAVMIVRSGFTAQGLLQRLSRLLERIHPRDDEKEKRDPK